GVRITVTPSRSMRFPLVLRVPAWADGATVRIRSEARQGMRPGGLHRLERTRNGPTVLSLRFPMRPAISVRYNDAVTVERGPLVYTLPIGPQCARRHRGTPQRDR